MPQNKCLEHKGEKVMGLFNRGYDDVEKIAKQREEEQTNTVFRFWMPKDIETHIMFLDDNPPKYDEHQSYIDGNWKNWDTCLKQFSKKCPLCEAGNKAYLAAAYTIIDLTEWTSKKGEKHLNERKMYVVKFDSLKALKSLSAKVRGLRGSVWALSRSGDKSANTGNVFFPIGKLTEDELKMALEGKYTNEDYKTLFKNTKINSIDPYDYDAILAPKDPEKMSASVDKAAETSYDQEEKVRF